jgi:hypothetical protein
MLDLWTRLALPFARISASFSAINAAPFLHHWNNVSKLLIFRKAIIQKRLPGHFAELVLDLAQAVHQGRLVRLHRQQRLPLVVDRALHALRFVL